MRESLAAVKRRPLSEKLRLRLGNPIDWLQHQAWWRRLAAIPEDMPFRYPFTAGLLSLLVPGAGHWYAGQGTKAVLIFLLAVPFVAVALLTITQPWSNYILSALVAYYLLIWTDSVAVATRANGNPWRPRKTLALLSAAVMLFGLTVSALQFFGAGLFTLEKVSSNSLQPALHEDDRIVFSFVPMWLRDPKPGEIIMFHPGQFSATQGKDIYAILVKKYYQRVLGVPGDHLKKEGSAFYRNGNVVPAAMVPFGGEDLPDFDITVPEDQFFVPVTGIPRDWLAGLKGAGNISYVGQPGFVFPKFPQQALVPENMVRSKGIAVINPPERRRWL
jgi:signal peptidase I